MSGFVQCDRGEVEDVEHFLLHCTGLVEERMEMYVEIDERDCGGVARDGGQGEGGMGDRSGM